MKRAVTDTNISQVNQAVKFESSSLSKTKFYDSEELNLEQIRCENLQLKIFSPLRSVYTSRHVFSIISFNIYLSILELNITPKQVARLARPKLTHMTV
jgi:hypothetical protein